MCVTRFCGSWFSPGGKRPEFPLVTFIATKYTTECRTKYTTEYTSTKYTTKYKAHSEVHKYAVYHKVHKYEVHNTLEDRVHNRVHSEVHKYKIHNIVQSIQQAPTKVHREVRSKVLKPGEKKREKKRSEGFSMSAGRGQNSK